MEGYTDANLAIYDLVMAFFRNGSINIIYFDMTFWLVQNYKINTKYKITEVFITCVGLSMICVYPADDVRGSFCRLVALVMLSFHQFVQRALKSPVTIEQIGNS